MRNIFVVRLSNENGSAMRDYRISIRNKLPQSILSDVLESDAEFYERIKEFFGDDDFNVWGTANDRFDAKSVSYKKASMNRSHFDKMESGDYVLFVEGGDSNIIEYIGMVVFKIESTKLSEIIWSSSVAQDKYDFIYFISDLEKVNFSFNKFKKMINWSENGNPRGFTSLDATRAMLFYDTYGEDLYEILRNK